MKPKKIYLRENELEDQFMCERMVSCDASIGSCNVEYTDISQVWHDASEEPKDETRILIEYDYLGSKEFQSYNIGDGLVNLERLKKYYRISRWAYISDLLPKCSE